LIIIAETPAANGEVHATHHTPTATPASAPSIAVSTPSSSHTVSNIPQQLNLSDLINIGYSCSTPGCKEKFDDKLGLQNHERTCIHKKYPCTHPECDRRFKNSKQRHAHMTSRHRGSENTFRCTVPECAAFFKTADRLKVHESRCRFKYEQFQLMDVEESVNNNNNSNRYSSPNQSSVTTLTTSIPTPTTTAVLLNSGTETTVVIEPHHHHSGPHTAFTSPSTLQSASIMPDVHTMTIPAGVRIKLENSDPTNVQVVQAEGLQGFSTVDLSLVKSEVME
jgi:hypothetical protein